LSLIFEMCMIVLFGASWPVSLYKSWKSRTNKGKSILFLFLIWVGYVCGITGKLLTHNVNYVLVFYIINICMVSADIFFYFRNGRIMKTEAELH